MPTLTTPTRSGTASRSVGTEAEALPLRHGAPAFLRLPASALLLLIRFYQHTLSPILPVLTLGRCGCRFSPTCSHYAAEAIRTHGALAGLGLALVRLIKCTPLHPGGHDPVPPRSPAPRCTAVRLSPPASSL